MNYDLADIPSPCNDCHEGSIPGFEQKILFSIHYVTNLMINLSKTLVFFMFNIY